MPSLEKEQLLTYFQETYHGLVKRNRVGPNRDQAQSVAAWELAFPGRALGCFYLQTAQGQEASVTVTADVDGGDDQGIDLFYYDPSSHRLILLQAKGGQDDGPDRCPSLADTNRFITGIRSFLTGNHTAFNEFTPQQTQLASDACNDPELQISVVFAHFGGELSEHTKREFEKLSTELNSSYPDERVHIINFNRDEAHKALLKIKSDQPVSCRLKLESYAQHDGLLRCFYGLALASDLKKVHLDNQDNPSLYAQNVRAFYGDNAVNLKVKETLNQEPNLLFYLNNGVTAICRSINPVPQVSEDGSREFQIDDISIVNGAQTIGTIAQSLPDGDASAHVFLKIIEVSNADEELTLKIARATNLQTSVDNLDFLSTHPRHQQLAATLKESGVTYQFKRSAEYGTNRLAPDKFTVQEAIEARICVSGDPKLLRNLKAQPSKLHEDFRNNIGLLFPADLSARTLWRQIQISRIAQEVIESARESDPQARPRTFFTHGMFFLKHLIFKKSRQIEASENMSLSQEDEELIREMEDSLILEAFAIAQGSFGAGHTDWNYIFKTIRAVEDLLRITSTLTSPSHV